MFLFVISLAYVGWQASWRSLFLAALVVTIVSAGVLVWVAQVQPSELMALAPRMALSVATNTALFLAIGAVIVLVRKRMIDRDQKEAQDLADILTKIHTPKDRP